MVASYVFRRPAHGNYLSLLTNGFDLYQSPLLEYRTDKGCLIASQLEITERLGKDPVPTLLFNRMLSYLDRQGAPSAKEPRFTVRRTQWSSFRSSASRGKR